MMNGSNTVQFVYNIENCDCGLTGGMVCVGVGR